jgi:mannan endo-1,4-beta-mannosidase
MKKLSFVLLVFSSLLMLTSCHSQKPQVSPFIHVENGQFVRNGQAYYFVGTNFWYGAILGSTGQGGDRARLARELDYMKSIGIDNLRVLVGADGERGVPAKVEPTLQIAPGVYNDTIFDGLDYLMAELGKRDMVAVLYMNNSWEWTGGYSVYLEWAGAGKAPIPAVDGWEPYRERVEQYAQNDSAKAMFKRHVQHVVTRTNRYTGLKYIDDPALFAWQIGNEPRPFGEKNFPAFEAWVLDVAAQIKSLDPNHMVATGSEGKWGCEGDVAMCERIHADKNIDYLNFHLWPLNWKWISDSTVCENLPVAKREAKAYIDLHAGMAARIGKPMVMEEFGFPRDGFEFSKASTTHCRDEFYSYIFSLIEADKEAHGYFAGCNFWGWGGFAEPSKEHIWWAVGDDYTGDPAQEQQGLNSVFASDVSTCEIIHAAADKLK